MVLKYLRKGIPSHPNPSIHMQIGGVGADSNFLREHQLELRNMRQKQSQAVTNLTEKHRIDMDNFTVLRAHFVQGTSCIPCSSRLDHIVPSNPRSIIGILHRHPSLVLRAHPTRSTPCSHHSKYSVLIIRGTPCSFPSSASSNLTWTHYRT